MALQRFNYGFSAYGVRIGIESNRLYLLEAVKNELPVLLPLKIEVLEFEKTACRFFVEALGGDLFRVSIDSEEVFRGSKSRKTVESCLSHLRLKIAEYAESKVFLHAGVVGWKGTAIILPAKSFQGKTTLVAELVKSGAEYYSDEYAVLDERGLVCPFPKMLSMRGIIDKYTQTDIAPEVYGRTGEKPVAVGLVLFTEYLAGAVWQPEELSVGQGVLEILPHTIPIRRRPEFSLSVLNKILSRAIILKSQRSEAPQFAQILLEYLDKKLGNK